MAYSNYGATVHCDGYPRHENCDVTMGQILGKTKFYHMGKDLHKTEDNDMYHAIVGDKESGIFVLLHKSSPSKILKINHKGEMVEVPFTYNWEDEWGVDVMVGDVKIELRGIEEPEGVTCSFTDRNGRKWFGKSAYCYGEGHRPWGKE